MTLSNQTRILANRYWLCLLGDWKSVLLLLAQAPLIGWFCTLVWGSVEKETDMLYFVLCLSSVWFGCINACREIVKERSIFERERIFGISIWAYVLSKLQVLAIIALFQVILLQMAVEWELSMKGPMVVQMMALWCVALSGTGLGLLVSAFAGTQERAVFSIPLLIIPQILFSEMALPAKYFGDAMTVIEKLMPVRWAFQVFQELAHHETQWHWVVLNLGVLLLFTCIFILFAGMSLLIKREL